MKNKHLQQFLIILGCAILSIALSALTIINNNLNLSKEELQSLSSLTGFTSELLGVFMGESFTLLALGKSVFAAMFILLIPVTLSIASVFTQLFSFLLQTGKERKWKKLFSDTFAITTFGAISGICISLLLSLICSFGCSRWLILLVFCLNLACLILLIKPLRETLGIKENLGINKKEKEKKVNRRTQNNKTKDKTIESSRREKKKDKAAQGMKEEELKIDVEIEDVEGNEKEYHCPTCGELLVSLVPGGNVLHCEKCGGVYGKDDYALNGKDEKM